MYPNQSMCQPLLYNGYIGTFPTNYPSLYYSFAPVQPFSNTAQPYFPPPSYYTAQLQQQQQQQQNQQARSSLCESQCQENTQDTCE